MHRELQQRPGYNAAVQCVFIYVNGTPSFQRRSNMERTEKATTTVPLSVTFARANCLDLSKPAAAEATIP